VSSEALDLPTPARERWREPTRALPLTWGRYEDRYAWGIILIIAGAVGFQAASTWSNSFLLQGAVVYALGWSILPARGWRRILAVPVTGQLWLLLTGPLSVWTLVVPYLAWLLVRHRPLRSYVTIFLPVMSAVLISPLFTEYSAMIPALLVSLAVLVGSAWAARALATTVRPRRARALPSSSQTG
jgi:hypothetical protein